MGLPQPVSDMVIVTVVLAVYPTAAPLLPAMEKLPQEPAVVVVVVDEDDVVVVDDDVVVALAARVTLPGVSTTDSRSSRACPIVGTEWYCTTTVRRFRFCVPAIDASSTHVTYW